MSRKVQEKDSKIDFYFKIIINFLLIYINLNNKNNINYNLS